MTLQIKTLILLFISFSFSFLCTSGAQNISGTIKFKTRTGRHPDSGAKVYLCHRTQNIHIDGNKIMLKREIQTEYELSLSGSAKRVARHKSVLLRQYGINDSADMRKYFTEAEHEENKITSARDVQMRVADSNGFYIFKDIPEGNYYVLIRSANTNRSEYYAIDVEHHVETDISRVFGE